MHIVVLFYAHHTKMTHQLLNSVSLNIYSDNERLQTS